MINNKPDKYAVYAYYDHQEWTQGEIISLHKTEELAWAACHRGGWYTCRTVTMVPAMAKRGMTVREAKLLDDPENIWG
jgi:hypothetical protein